MTSGKEDYLKAIYIISEDHELVSNKELSDMLHVREISEAARLMRRMQFGLTYSKVRESEAIMNTSSTFWESWLNSPSR